MARLNFKVDRVETAEISKQVAAELGIVEKTVKVHRARVLAKP